jgi:hypothetical protein
LWFCSSKIKSKFRIGTTWEIVIFCVFAGWKLVFYASNCPWRRVKILKILMFQIHVFCCIWCDPSFFLQK